MTDAAKTSTEKIVKKLGTIRNRLMDQHIEIAKQTGAIGTGYQGWAHVIDDAIDHIRAQDVVIALLIAERTGGINTEKLQ